MRMHEAPSGEPSQVQSTEEPSRAERLGNSPVNQQWLDETTFQLAQQHARGEIKLDIGNLKSGQRMSETIFAAAEQRAREIWELASGAEGEKRQVRRGLAGKLKKYATYGLIGLGATTSGVGLALAAKAVETELTSQRVNKDFSATVAKETDKLIAEEAKKAAGDVEIKPELPIELTGLDREATPERIHRLLDETFPKGWTEHLRTATYSPNYENGDDNMSSKGWMTMAQVTPYGSKADLRFFASSLGSVQESLGDNLAHELGHLNDWRYPGLASPEEAIDMEAAVASSLLSDKRYYSAYVESIDNKDKDVKERMRRIEYWAEINEVYFTTLNPEEQLNAADLANVEENIRRKDPNFDHDAALEKRRAIFDGMAAPQFSERLNTFLAHLPAPKASDKYLLPGDLKELMQSHWLGYRFQDSPERQKEGRQELVKLAEKWQGNPDAVAYLRSLVADWSRLDRATRTVADGTFGIDTFLDEKGLEEVFPKNRAEKLDEATRAEIRRDFDDLMSHYSFTTGVRVTDGEYGKLVAAGGDLAYLMEYEPSKADLPLKKFKDMCYPDSLAGRRDAGLMPL